MARKFYSKETPRAALTPEPDPQRLAAELLFLQSLGQKQEAALSLSPELALWFGEQAPPPGASSFYPSRRS